MDLERTHTDFHTTCWTIVDLIKVGTPEEKRQCLDMLCRMYARPIYAFFRRESRSRNDAADLTQQFFHDKIISGALFERVERDRGRVRDYVKQAARNFIVDKHRATRAQSTMALIPLDVELLEQFLSQDDATSDQVFDRVSEAELLDEVMRVAEQYYISKGMERHWRLYEAHRVIPARTGGVSRGLEELGREFGFQSAAAARAAVQVVTDRTRVIYTGLADVPVAQHRR